MPASYPALESRTTIPGVATLLRALQRALTRPASDDLSTAGTPLFLGHQTTRT